jgi:protein TonB
LSAHAQAETDEWPSDSVDVEATKEAYDEQHFISEGIRAFLAASDSTVYTTIEVDQLPQLPVGGGEQAIIQAIQKTVRYPKRAIEAKRQGIITVSFVVDQNGQATNLKIIRGLGYGIDEEVIRAIGALPRFICAKCNGYAVQSNLTLPISLRLF